MIAPGEFLKDQIGYTSFVVSFGAEPVRLEGSGVVKPKQRHSISLTFPRVADASLRISVNQLMNHSSNPRLTIALFSLGAFT
jgi:hypothetical protein